MKHSIKRQLAGIFIGVMAGTFLCCGLVNALFLAEYEETAEQLIYEKHMVPA